MNIYLLKWKKPSGYDVQVGAVVIAKDEPEARAIASKSGMDEGNLLWMDENEVSCVVMGTPNEGAKPHAVLLDQWHG